MAWTPPPIDWNDGGIVPSIEDPRETRRWRIEQEITSLDAAIRLVVDRMETASPAERVRYAEAYAEYWDRLDRLQRERDPARRVRETHARGRFFRNTAPAPDPAPIEVPRCRQCGHINAGHRREPGIGCAMTGCLCLETGDLPLPPLRIVLPVVSRETVRPPDPRYPAPEPWWRRVRGWWEEMVA